MIGKRNLILHVGLHKTGTTFLQQMFARNIERFAAAGVVPAGMFNSETGHHHKLLSLLKEGRDDEFFSELNAPGDETILVTSEGFTTWFSRNSDAVNAAFAARMKQFNVRVVVFLRRQDFLKESVYAEVATNNFTGPIEKENHYFYDFDLFLTKLEEMFGLDSIGLGIYRDDYSVDLMSDFLHLTGIDLEPNSLEVIPPQRVSLHRRKVAILASTPKKPRNNYLKVRAGIAACKDIHDDGIKYQMSPEARLAYLKKFHTGNLRVSQRYGLDSMTAAYLSSNDLDLRKWAPLPPPSKKERKFVSEILEEQGLGEISRPDWNL